MKNVFITIPVGQSIRDYLILDGIKDILTESKGELNPIVLSPAYRVDSFNHLCEDSSLSVERCETPNHYRPNNRYVAWRKKRHFPSSLVNPLIKQEVKKYSSPKYLISLFEKYMPAAVISTHPMTSHDYHVFMTAKKFDCPVFGIVKSWDNLIKGLAVHADKLSVWSERNKREAIKYNSYSPDDVAVNGAIAFDPYFQKDWLLTRQEFAERMRLDPSRKIVTVATAGSYGHGYYGCDETHHTLDVIKILRESSRYKNAQIIVRLHPVSKLEHYLYLKEQFPDLIISHGSYMPTIGWYINKQDMIEQVNILAHSDVIATPGSSWVIEAAIFDTPVVVTFYSNLQPDHAKLLYNSSMSKHFAPIVENKWVPICYSFEQTKKEILAALSSKEYYSFERKTLIDNYVQFSDGESSKRIAKWIVELLL